MGYDLSGAGGAFRLNKWGWEAAYDLGVQHGWKPTGTECPEDSEWSGGYFSNDYQRVKTEDAAAWADALERALPDVPRHDAMEHKTTTVAGFQVYDTPVSPVELFSGEDGREKLQEFIAFLRAGSFVIG